MANEALHVIRFDPPTQISMCMYSGTHVRTYVCVYSLYIHICALQFPLNGQIYFACMIKPAGLTADY